MEIEAKLLPKILQRSAAGRSLMSSGVGATGRVVREGEKSMLSALETALAGFRTARDAEGLSVYDRWERARFEGLTNDERVLLKAYRAPKLKLLEIRGMSEEGLIEVVDLFEGNAGRSRWFVDPTLMSEAFRFMVCLVSVLECPCYDRAEIRFGCVDSIGTRDALSVVGSIVAAMGGPAERERWSEWLVGKESRLLDILDEVRDEIDRRLDLEQHESGEGQADGGKEEGTDEQRVSVGVSGPLAELVEEGVLGMRGLGSPPDLEEDCGGDRIEYARRSEEGFRGLVEVTMPLLQGLSLREAARDPALRPKVLVLVKSLIRTADGGCRRRGVGAPVEWLARELGLPEVDVPPLRPAAQTEGGFGRAAVEGNTVRELMARRLDPPLTHAQAVTAWESAAVRYAKASNAMAAVGAGGERLIEDVMRLADLESSQEALLWLEMVLLRSCVALKRAGVEIPAIHPPLVTEVFELILRELLEGAREGTKKSLAAMLSESGRQPAILGLAAEDLARGLVGLPGASHEETVRDTMRMSVLLRVLIDIVDACGCEAVSGERRAVSGER